MENGRSPDPRWIIAAEGSRTAGGHRAAEYLLSEPQLPTAVVAVSDELAIGALRAFRRAGLTAPGTLSIIGFDDHEMAECSDLTIHQPVTQQAHLTAARLGSPAQPTNLVFRIRVRGTTGPPS